MVPDSRRMRGGMGSARGGARGQAIKSKEAALSRTPSNTTPRRPIAL